MKAAFVDQLERQVWKNPNIFVLASDSGQLFDSFREKHPDNFMSFDSEEIMIGIGAGMAWAGRKVYCYSTVPFLMIRGLKAVKQDICPGKLNIVLLGGGGGLLYGKEGTTRQSIEDISLMRHFPEMTVASPGDTMEAQALAKESADFEGPLYIRFGRDDAPLVHRNEVNLKIGKGAVLNKGKEIALIASGSALYEAKGAAEVLEEKGIRISLVSMPTIKPIDEALIKDLASSCENIFSFEDHSINGGLGSAIQEVLNKIHYRGRFKKLGLPDDYSKYLGTMDHLYHEFGMDPKSIADKIIKISS